MRCPHCERNLLGKQRTSARCSLCDTVFALDPKTNDVLLHDLRLRKLADKLSDGGRLRYTVGQLHHAAARKPLRRPRDSIVGNVIAVVVFGFLGAILIDVNEWFALIGWGIAAINLVVMVGRLGRRRDVTVPMTRQGFRIEILARWRNVYDTSLPGLVDEELFTLDDPAHPKVALLCQDRDVRVCLAANGIAQRHEIALVSDPRAVPAGLPVVIMHDASVAGCGYAVAARTALADREVTIAGIRPRMVMSAKGALRLRRPVLDRQAIRALRGELVDDEIRWLAKGWWVPLASVPPAKLVTAATRAIRRVNDRAMAERVGFLSWPVT